MILGTLSNDHNDDDNNVKKNWFYEQNNCSAHFLDVHCTGTTWNLPMRRFMEDVVILQQFFPSLFEHG